MSMFMKQNYMQTILGWQFSKNCSKFQNEIYNKQTILNSLRTASHVLNLTIWPQRNRKDFEKIEQ